MSESSRHQRGITLLGFLFVLIVVGFLVYLGIRLFPIYQEFYSVSSAMEKVKQEPGVGQKSPNEIRNMLFAQLYISYVESVKPQHVNITRDRTGYTMTVQYETEQPFIHNIFFVGRFDKTVELTGRPGD